MTIVIGRAMEMDHAKCRPTCYDEHQVFRVVNHFNLFHMVDLY